ncbi:hypothetical protein GPJ56_004858 [Histomonas meleagridis]|uniref:uncharacterized protein n=1 Tax=Histomonas meleagridis TaxID=135588 RepID=UPI003559E005|nr:hypothetical protein GPJ56_004858 [Histomonas meleagridis]KAH0803508.1 hypothetical protein GO595_003852 [Histomonas meleagridis]
MSQFPINKDKNEKLTPFPSVPSDGLEILPPPISSVGMENQVKPQNENNEKKIPPPINSETLSKFPLPVYEHGNEEIDMFPPPIESNDLESNEVRKLPDPIDSMYNYD